MNPKEIQAIKDKAAREMMFKDYADFEKNAKLYQTQILLDSFSEMITEAIELASKREVRVPTKEDVNEECEKRAKGQSMFAVREREFKWMNKGANWAIEKIRELNQ